MSADTKWSPRVHRWMSRKAREVMRVHNVTYKVALRDVAMLLSPRRRPPGGALGAGVR